ncbi:hypothetical protein ETB97_002458 [Aspergillus alliaceus]|uniref:N-acetyltransferase domain-containing protein n=1 Tax=Petromyces alliaceus TaxID=209559 RepID=A0A8H6A0P5_PETAA|nr:hypothetical protein ETB97_002458 [Aspergillus burnettii]
MTISTSPKSPLSLEPATLKDIPALTELWYNAFRNSPIIAIWPDTPGVHQWWNEANTHDMLHKPGEKYLKIVDTQTRRIAAYAKWSLESAEERGRRFPAWHSDMNAQGNEEFLENMETGRDRLVGGRKNFYLDMIATRTEYRKMGAARMLIEWGCAVADREGAAVYIDASQQGRPVYEKFGFVDFSDERSAAAGLASMVREPMV